MMNQKIKRLLLFSVFLISLFFIISLSSFAQSNQTEDTEREFIIYSQFSNLTLEEGAETNLDIKIINEGEQPENIKLDLIIDQDSADWDIVLLNESYRGFKVSQVNLLSEEPDNLKTLTLHIEIPEEIEMIKEEYVFTIKAESVDGYLSRSFDIVVKVDEKAEKEIEEGTNEILISTKYPTLESPSGQVMKYEIEVKNQTEEEQVMDFTVDIPQGWRASISPRWREEERISALKINKAGSETLLLSITPPYSAEKDEYDLQFIARAGELEKTLDLKAIVTGTYKLGMGTESGNLKLSAVAGEEKDYSFYIWNEGSAVIDNVSFTGNVPDGWEVKFDPEKLDELASVVQSQKPEKITMTLNVPQNTIPGDYLVTVNAGGNQDQKEIQFRTTVQVPTKWGWIGVVIILAILAILLGIFMKLKRR